ncbi:MAG: thioredoxin domain-containing protein [Polyangiaceae bacterium]
MASEHTNRLIDETSPYLLQHAHNPVDWYPWGPEAFERARREDKPVLLSVGYSACHWCHVMEHESFSNDAIARQMNEGFVCIKVDREERPDVDEVYMAATVAMSGSGGWPMTVFMNAAQEPFFAGTYFPPADAYGRIGFPSLLARVKELWQSDRARLQQHAEELVAALRGQAEQATPSALDPAVLGRAARAHLRRYDPRWGGFGRAPKFPPSSALSLLMRLYNTSGDPALLDAVTGTLDGMKNGGMYDHVGGGFCRYSTDERWFLPHFEKMLYDNAQLASVYLEAYQLTHESEYARVARETLDYVAREMQDAAGGYYSSTDADSEGEEGKYFVFYKDELIELLGPPLGELFADYYGVLPEGNWEGKNVLHTPRPLAQVASEHGLESSAAAAELGKARERVYERRRLRVPPALDDKILTGWNGLMIGAMADGARVLGNARYLRSAERAAEHAALHLRRSDGGLYRSVRHGRAKLDGYLEDYAALGDGLLSLYEAGGRLGAGPGAADALLRLVKELCQRMLRDFEAESGGFFFTAHTHEALLVRSKEGHDGALPSPNALAARLCVRLAQHLDAPELRRAGERALEAFALGMERAPEAFPTALSVLDRLRAEPLELVVAGARGEPELGALLAQAALVYLPNAARAVVDTGVEHDAPGAPGMQAGALSPLTRGKLAIEGRAALYLCRGYACDAPITDPALVLPAIASSVAREPRSEREIPTD